MGTDWCTKGCQTNKISLETIPLGNTEEVAPFEERERRHLKMLHQLTKSKSFKDAVRDMWKGVPEGTKGKPKWRLDEEGKTCR
jgi:hypothetical protein